MKGTIVKSALLIVGSLMAWACAPQASVRAAKTALHKSTSPLFRERMQRRSKLLEDANRAWYGRRDLAQAERLLREYITLEPQSTLPWIDLARILDQAGKRSEAIAAYRVASKEVIMDPTQDQVMLGRYAELCEFEGLKEEALLIYRLMIERYTPPSNSRMPKLNLSAKRPNEVKSVAKIIDAFALQLTDYKEKEAIEALRAAVSEDPESAAAHFYLGVTLMYDEVGRPTAAEQFRIAMKLAPNDRSIQENSRMFLGELK